MINPRQVIVPLFFLTGFAGVVHEIVSLRQLTSLWGGGFQTAGMVAGVFLVGVALGGVVIGRLGDRVKDSLILFGGIEVIAGLYALASPSGLSIVEGMYSTGGFPHPLLKIILASLFFLVPSMLLGGCIPVVGTLMARSSAISSSARETARSAGGLYAAGLFGAASGGLACGFVLLEHLGAKSSLFIAGGGHLAVAATIFVLRLTGKERQTPPREEESPPGRRASSDSLEFPGFVARSLAAGAIVLVGAALSSHWALWTRLLVQFFSDSVYSLSIVLFSFLVSLAGGGALGAWIARRTQSAPRTMAVFQLGGATASVAVLYLVHWFGVDGRYSMLVLDFGANVSFSALVGLEIICAFCLLFVPGFLLGTAFPLFVSMNWREPPRWGRFIGDIQFFLAGGAAAGLIVTVCSILPGGIGSGRSIFFAAGFSAAAAWLLLCSRLSPSGKSLSIKTWLAAAGFTGATLLLALGLPRSFELWKKSFLDRKCLYYSEGPTAAVAVVEMADGVALKVDNAEGLAGSRGELLEMRLGMFPGLLCDPPQRALCLGLGTGHSLMGLIGNSPREVDCIEELPAVVEAAHCFHNFSAEVPRETTLTITAGDVRVFVSSTDKTYDLIVGNPVDPSRTGAGFLHTREHFESVYNRLSEKGLFCQWIPLHQMHWEDFGIIGYTFSEVFDHMAVFLAYTETPFPIVGLVGTRQPLRVDPRAMQERLDLHPYRRLLEKIGLDNALENLSLYVNDQWLFRTRFPDPRVNTDDRPLTEFHAARLMERPDVLGFKHFLQLAEPRLNEDVLPLLDPARLEGQERREFEVEIRSYSDGLRQYLACHAYELWEMILQPVEALSPNSPVSAELRRLFEKRFDAAIEAFRLAPEHRVLRGNIVRLWRVLIQRNELVRAANLMATASKARPDDASLKFNWGLSYLLQEQYESAAVMFEKTLALDSDYASARLHYGIALFCKGTRVRAREELDRVLSASGGMEHLSELTRALTTVILDGHEKAQPLLDRYENQGPWRALIDRVVEQSRASGETSPNSANSNGD